jgi:hypothetical protein
MQKFDPFDLQVSAQVIGPRTWQWHLWFEKSSPPFCSGVVEGYYHDAIKAGEEERLKLVYKNEDIWV